MAHSSKSRVLAIVSALCLCLAALVIVNAPSASGTTLRFTKPCGYTGTPTAITHVVNIHMENQSYGNLIGRDINRTDGSGPYTGWPTQATKGTPIGTPGGNISVPKSGINSATTFTGHTGEFPDWWYDPVQVGKVPGLGSTDTNSIDDPNPGVDQNGTFDKGTSATADGLRYNCGYSNQFAGGSHSSTDNYFEQIQGSYPTSQVTGHPTINGVVQSTNITEQSGANQDCKTTGFELLNLGTPCTNVAANYSGASGYNTLPTDNLYTQLNAKFGQGTGTAWQVYQEEAGTSGSALASNCNTWVNYENRDVVKFNVGNGLPGSVTQADCTANDIGVGLDPNVGNGAALSEADSSNPLWTALQNVDTAGGIAPYVDVVPDINEMSESSATATNGDGTASGCVGLSDRNPGTKPSLKQCREANADAFIQSVTSYIWRSPQYQAGNTVVLITYDEGSGYGSQFSDCKIGSAVTCSGAPNNGLPASVASFASTAENNGVQDPNHIGQECTPGYLKGTSHFCTMYQDDYSTAGELGSVAGSGGTGSPGGAACQSDGYFGAGGIAPCGLNDTNNALGLGENCSGLNDNFSGNGGADVIRDRYPSCNVPFYIMYPYTPSGTLVNNYFSPFSILRGIEDTFGLTHLGMAGVNTCGATGTQACWGTWHGFFGT